MNQAVRDYVASVVERNRALVRGAFVLELGSRNVNGEVRDLFDGAGCGGYVGIDKQAGPGVGQVVDAHEVAGLMPGGLVDVLVCCEMLEHDSDIYRTAEQIRQIGPKLLVATTRGIGYGLHDMPEDYWRFTEHGLRLWFERAGFPNAEVIDHTESKGVFGYGIR